MAESWVPSSLALLLACAGCIHQQPDVAGSGDERYDETSRPDKPRVEVKDSSQCGPEGKGDVVLLDARTALPVACALVTIFREPDEQIFQGHTNQSGVVNVGQSVDKLKVYAVAEGYAQSWRQAAAVSAGRLAEIEMLPDDGFLLKVLDGDGNYVQGVEVTFKQGDQVLAQMRTNDLANVFFTARTPFAGEPVTIEAEGYAPVTVASASELGADGHTVTVRR